MTLSTADNVALFHARAIRDYCNSKKCKDCVFCINCACELERSSPDFWKNIERRDLDNAVVD